MKDSSKLNKIFPSTLEQFIAWWKTQPISVQPPLMCNLDVNPYGQNVLGLIQPSWAKIQDDTIHIGGQK